jgi:hypothetical protein
MYYVERRENYITTFYMNVVSFSLPDDNFHRFSFYLFLQMDIPTRVVRVSSLVKYRPYPIISAERVGGSVLIKFLDLPDHISQTPLDNAGCVFSDEDLANINSCENIYTMIYRGRVNGSDYHVIDVKFESVSFIFLPFALQSRVQPDEGVRETCNVT